MLHPQHTEADGPEVHGAQSLRFRTIQIITHGLSATCMVQNFKITLGSRVLLRLKTSSQAH